MITCTVLSMLFICLIWLYGENRQVGFGDDQAALLLVCAAIVAVAGYWLWGCTN